MKPIQFFLIAMLVVLTGCHLMTSSGIPEAVTADSVIQAAGSAQGISLQGGSESEMLTLHRLGVDRTWHASIATGTVGQLLAKYRRAVEDNITSRGGAISKASFVGTTNDVQEFSFDYAWSANEGAVHGTASVGSGGEVQIEVACDEHPK
ncbi:MAG: hypothetical protein P4M10_04245 [Verrucomicrobiae bacterium]|nr:hypothetical protein [Verrucomicrobiae bacterium]